MAHGKSWMLQRKVCWPACKECWDAHEAYLKDQRLRRGLSRTDKRIDAGRARERIIDLRDVYNVTDIEIGKRIGMHPTHVGRVANGRTNVIYTSKARAVLKLYNEVSNHEGRRHHWNPDMVPSDRARLALRGLAAQGWSRPKIRERIGLDFNTMLMVMRDADTPGARKFIRRSTEKRILDLAREIGSASGGNNYVSTTARMKGWMPTMYYDELV